MSSVSEDGKPFYTVSQANENSVFQQCRQGLYRLSMDNHFEWGKSLPDALWDTSKPIPRKKATAMGYINDEVYAHLPNSIKRMETLIETFQRLDGYLHELETHRQNEISFKSWERAIHQLETSGDTLKLGFLIPRFSKDLWQAYSQVGEEVDL